VYRKHGAYWLVKRGKWTRLADDRQAALVAYAAFTTAPKQGRMPDLIERAYKHHIKGLSQQTANAYASAKKRLCEVFKDFDPRQVQPKHVAALRLADSNTPNAANRNQTFLKIVMDFALELGEIDSNPVVGAKRLKEAERDRYITDDEFRRIHAQAGEKLRIIMEICYLTGQRIGDVMRIRFDHLTPEGVQFKQGKTGAKLTVAYTPELQAAISRAKALLTDGKVQLLPQGYLLRSDLAGRRHAHPSYSAILAAWTKACQAAGVKDANPHDLRAKAATDGKKQGKDATALLGHANARQTETYLRGLESPLVEGPTMKGMK
jgi:integrase